MSLTPGTRLGPYEILSAIGAGGMGEVYRANDTSLKRQVAIKVLPQAMAADPERLARFQREAEVLAALNHPNIAHIYGLERQEGREGQDRQLALVMELVEGPTLAEMLAGSGPAATSEAQSPKPKAGGLPLHDALNIARQLAEALEAAHEQGIIHRDLKPANIKVREDGTVKVLDFGLAKLVDPAAASTASASMSPTLSVHATMAGVILGTAAYMSPEQARGKTVDKRADIWAFGCVLFEMLTGTRAFEGDEITDILAAVVRAEPAWGQLPADTPAAIRRLLQRCLEKDRKERLPDIGVARLDIKESLASPTGTVTVAATRTWRGRLAGPRLAWSVAAIAAVLALASATFAISYLRTGPSIPPVVRFQLSAPSSWTFLVNGQGPMMDVSPDGTQIAFAATTADGKTIQLWVRPIDAVEARALPGTEGARTPFWSPDSRSIGFFANAQLKRIDVAGGSPQIVWTFPSGTTVGNTSIGTWNQQGVIVFSQSTTLALFSVSANGGTAKQLTTLDATRQELAHMWPRFLPDGRHFIYLARSSTPDRSAIKVGSLDSRDTQLILASDVAADFAPPNYLLYRRDSSLLMQPLDLVTFQLEGEPVRIADPVGASTGTGRPGFSVSRSGALAFFPIGGSTGDLELAWYDRTGKKLGTAGTASYRGLDLSPDGKQVAVHIHNAAGGDIWLLDLERGGSQRFTFDTTQDSCAPLWSPDGSHIAFASLRAGLWGLYQKPSNGVGAEELLYESPTPKAPMSWSPDGKSLLFANTDQATATDLWLLPLADRKPVAYLQSRFAEQNGQISPNGKWVAYTSTQDSRAQVYVQALSGAVSKWLVSANGGGSARWRRDGKELFFVGTGGLSAAGVYAVTVEAAGDGLRFGVPQLILDRLISRPVPHPPQYHGYAVSADGQHFLIQQTADEQGSAATSPITIVLNWTAGLKK